MNTRYLSFCIAPMLALFTGCASAIPAPVTTPVVAITPPPPPPPAEPPPAPPAKLAAKVELPIEAEWEGKSFRAGDRVRITSRAGTFKPIDTQQPVEIFADEGHEGTVIRGEKRVATSYFTPKPGEPIQILRVKFDEQDWTADTDAKVHLGTFETTIHVDYLEVIR